MATDLEKTFSNLRETLSNLEERPFDLEETLYNNETTGKIQCRNQQSEKNFTFCSKNKKRCEYIERTVIYQISKPIEKQTEFYLCSLNCNTWLYYPTEDSSGN